MLKGPKKKTVLFSSFYFLCSETDTASVFDSKWNIIMSRYIDLYARMPTRHECSIFPCSLHGRYEPSAKKTCQQKRKRRMSTNTHTHHQQQNQPPSCPTRLFWKSFLLRTSVPGSGTVKVWFRSLYSLVLAHQLSLCERRCSLLEC